MRAAGKSLRHRFDFLSLLLLLLAASLLAAGCGAGDAREGDENGDAAEAADSLDSGDSAAVAASDSTDAGGGGSKGNFLTRIFSKRGDKEDDDEEEAIPVEIALVEVRDVPSYIGGTATLEPEKRADIIAKISGEIESIRVEEGDRVREGQLLAVLDGKAERVALEEAEARARGLKLDFERVETLFGQDLVSTKEMNDSRSRFEESEAQRKAALLQLAYTRVVAPFSGQVSIRYVDPGQNVSIGTQLFSIVDAEPLLARVHLPEKEAARIRIGQPIVISPDADLSVELPGRVILVAPIVDARTGTIKITCMVEGTADAIRPGSFVRVKLETDKHDNVLVVPSRALIPEGGDTYVFKASEDTVIKLAVTTGYADDMFVEVTEGLEEGDRIVTVGQGGLRNGAK